MAHRITLILGVGTGSEVTEAAVHLLEATDVQSDWDVKEANIGAAEKYGSVLPWPGVRAGRPVIGQLSERMGKRSNTSCAETHSKHRE